MNKKEAEELWRFHQRIGRILSIGDREEQERRILPGMGNAMVF